MERHVDYLIVGAGPAGLQLGYFLQRDGRDYVIVERGPTPGTFFRRFPRHGTLISSNKIFTGTDDPEVNLRWDWNSLLSDVPELRFQHYSTQYFPPAPSLVRYLEDFCTVNHLNLVPNATIARIERNGAFHATTAEGDLFGAKRVIIATGVTQPYRPPIPGIELADAYTDVSIDPNDFKNKRVLILGKGNSAFETANHLVETAALIHIAGPRPVRMAWSSHFVGHLRAVNNTIIDTYQLKSQNALLDAHCDRIVMQGDQYVASFRYVRAIGEVQDIVYDRVINCTGFCFDPSMFAPAIAPALTINDRFPAQTSSWESTNVKDLFFAGTLMQTRDYKKSQSAFIHGFRYNVAALVKILYSRYDGEAWPSTPLGESPEELTTAILDRINHSSALWQQFGFLADVIVLGPDGARYCQEVPQDYVHDGGLGADLECLFVTLEYGLSDEHYDVFTSPRVVRTDVDNARDSKFLHPVVRRYSGRTCIAEHHVIENLFAEWVAPEHWHPLCEFLKRVAAGSLAA